VSAIQAWLNQSVTAGGMWATIVSFLALLFLFGVALLIVGRITSKSTVNGRPVPEDAAEAAIQTLIRDLRKQLLAKSPEHSHQ
jgi:hypothetical protein